MIGCIGKVVFRNTVGSFASITLGISLLISSSGLVFAEHEANHRYLVSGHVRDQAGKALAGVEVTLEHKGGKKKNTSTDGSGYYETRFHLHNQNHGEIIIVVANGKTKKVKVSFDVKDEVSFRGSTVDFGAPDSENSPIWVFLTIASLVVLSGTVYFGLIKAKKNPQQPKKSKQKGKRRKK